MSLSQVKKIVTFHGVRSLHINVFKVIIIRLHDMLLFTLVIVISAAENVGDLHLNIVGFLQQHIIILHMTR